MEINQGTLENLRRDGYMYSVIHFLCKADDIDWGSVRLFLAPQRLHFITSYTLAWHLKLTIHTDWSEPNALDIQNS